MQHSKIINGFVNSDAFNLSDKDLCEMIEREPSDTLIPAKKEVKTLTGQLFSNDSDVYNKARTRFRACLSTFRDSLVQYVRKNLVQIDEEYSQLPADNQMNFFNDARFNLESEKLKVYSLSSQLGIFNLIKHMFKDARRRSSAKWISKEQHICARSAVCVTVYKKQASKRL